MFSRVFVVQCLSSGEFLTVHLQYAHQLNRAGYFLDRQAAIDTGVSCLGSDFAIHDFYKRDSELPAYVRGDCTRRASGLSVPPM